MADPVHVLLFSNRVKIIRLCLTETEGLAALSTYSGRGPQLGCVSSQSTRLVIADAVALGHSDISRLYERFSRPQHIPFICIRTEQPPSSFFQQFPDAHILLCPWNPGSLVVLMKELLPALLSKEKKFSSISEQTLDYCAFVPPASDAFARICGTSAAVKVLKKQLQKVAASDFPVLLLGESGTGKTIAAEVLHQLSPRCNHSFCSINIASLKPELIESELFGTSSGAYTGAVERSGYFEKAAGGTLFLDEIGELELSLQAKLLDVIETGRFRRVGSTKEVRCGARIVLATNKNLKKRIIEGSFRSDLYYRIAGVCINLPPLRSRREDIPVLCAQILTPTGRTLSGEALQKLCTCDWPGNIRQLQNSLKNAVLQSDGEIQCDDIILE